MTLGEFFIGIHLAMPITGILLLAVKAEFKKISTERKKLAQTLLVASRGRRHYIGNRR